MEHREEDRFGRVLEQPIEQVEGRLRASLADRVGERPDRARDRLRDERPDVVGA